MRMQHWKTGMLITWMGFTTVLGLQAAPYVILKNGERQAGLDIRATRTGDIILRTERGNITYTQDEIVRAVADKPENWDAIGRAYTAKKFDDVIPALEEIVSQYAFLGWDEKAAALLGKAQLETGRSAEAMKTLEEVYKKTGGKDIGLKFAYFDAMIQNNRFSDVLPELEKAIAEGEREEAARAQLVRGNLYVKQGKVDDAVLDYLRTALLFKQQRELAAEGLFKAGEALLNAKRDVEAKRFLRMVIEQYGNSPFATQAKELL